MACSKFSHNDTASNGTYICEDLLTEIIIRLPPKSLFRFKCVSKAWHVLISSDQVQKRLPFTISGIYGSGNTQGFEHQYVCISNSKFISCDISFFPFHSHSRVISCCNGLVLLRCLFSQTFHVCSPATKRWFTLPSPKKSALLSLLAFDPSLSRQYSVVSFTGWKVQRAELEVFSSETGGWVEFDVHLGVECGMLSPIMSYFNGVLYVLSHLNCVVCIQLETRSCRQVQLPEPATAGAHLGKNGGKLCYYAGNGEREPSIWMLEDLDNCKWLFKHSISLKATTGLDSSRFLAFHPELELVYLLAAGKLISLDMGKNRIEEVGDFGKERGGGYLVQIWLFQFSNCLSDCLLREHQT